MSIATEIQRLNTAKSDIKTAIEAKGVTVPSSATIDTYDDYVSQISGGGGGGDNTTLKKMIDRTITSIDIPSGVTSIGDYAFSNCTSLTSCTIPSGVTSIGENAFSYCRSLANINIPSGVSSIGQGAFEYCSSLSSVTVNATTPPTLGSSVFDGTDSSLVIYVPSSSVSTYQSASGWSTYASKIQAIPNS